MELTEICGNLRLYFKDITFGLPVCSTTEHTAQLDSISELSFAAVREQYFKQMKTAVTLYSSSSPFELYFSVSGSELSDPSETASHLLYHCHVQCWNKRLAIDLYYPGISELISAGGLSSPDSVRKAICFAFGGFLYTCLDFKTSEIDFKAPEIAEALSLYCLTSNKQLLLNELFCAA